MEEWKPITGYENYEISNLGRVRNLKTDKLLKPFCQKDSDKITYSLYRKPVALSTLMRENWRYEWIKELEDGEEATAMKNHPNHFITTHGRIFSLHQYRFLSIFNGSSYYWRVRLDDSVHDIHKLVGREFLPEYEEGLEICHTDEHLPFPQINYLSNLWAGTPQQNCEDRENKGRGKRANPNIHNDLL